LTIRNPTPEHRKPNTMGLSGKRTHDFRNQKYRETPLDTARRTGSIFGDAGRRAAHHDHDTLHQGNA
jgi:hypothetical protein